jgi:hypothetical protein
VSCDPRTLYEAAHFTSDMWKRKFPNKEDAPKTKDLTINPISESIEDLVN